MKVITKDLNFCGIYMIINKVNGKRYIRSSKNIRCRLWEHRANLRHNHHSNTHLQNSWNKYKEASFDYCVLEKCTEEERFIREQFYVDNLKPEYNICIEVVENPPKSLDTRKKHSETRKKLMAEGIIKVTHNTPVYVYYKDGSYVGYWESIAKAAKHIGVSCCVAYKVLAKKYLQVKGYKFFKEKQSNVEPFSKPTNKGKEGKKADYIAINIEDNSILKFHGRDEAARYFNMTLGTLSNYIGGKHKVRRKYMVYKESAV